MGDKYTLGAILDGIFIPENATPFVRNFLMYVGHREVAIRALAAHLRRPRA